MQNISMLQAIMLQHHQGGITRLYRDRYLVSEIINPSCVTDEKMVYLAVCWLRDNSFPLVSELQLHLLYKYDTDLMQLVKNND